MIFESDRFTFTGDATVAEASDLGIGVPADSILIRSRRTGAVLLFTKTATVRDGEGEVTHWTFAPPATHAGLAPVSIFND